MLKKIICVILIIIILTSCFISYSYADTSIYRFWNNLPSNQFVNGGVIDYATLPTTLGENDKYMFYYYHHWGQNHVNYDFGFAVFRNASNSFNALYTTSLGNKDGVINFSGFTGCTVYNYNPSNNQYTVIYNNSTVITAELSHLAILGYNAQTIYQDAIPSIFYANFDVLDSTDTTKVSYYGGIYNSSLTFDDASILRAGGNSDTNFVLTNYFGNYDPLYEPVLYVYVGNNVSAETLVNTVYLNSFRLNSGNYSIPYNRLYPENYSSNTPIWFLLKTTDNNNKFVYSFTSFVTTGAISIENFTPTEPDEPSPTPTPTPRW